MCSKHVNQYGIKPGWVWPTPGWSRGTVWLLSTSHDSSTSTVDFWNQRVQQQFIRTFFILADLVEYVSTIYSRSHAKRHGSLAKVEDITVNSGSPWCVYVHWFQQGSCGDPSKTDLTRSVFDAHEGKPVKWTWPHQIGKWLVLISKWGPADVGTAGTKELCHRPNLI